MKVVDEVLVKLIGDPSALKRGLAEGATAGKKFVTELEKQSKTLAGLSITQGLAFAAQAKFIKDVTKAAGEQELAVAKLSSNLKAEQRTRADSIGVLTAQADALQKVTRFSDDQTIAAQAMLASFKLTDEQILQLTPRLQDVSENLAKLGDEEADLQKVALAFGKAIETGNTAALMRYGIQLEKEKDGTIDFGKVIDQLANSSFAGLAEAIGQTTQGRLAAFKNQINELQESIGFALLPTVNDLFSKLTPVISRFSEWAKAHGSIVLSILGGGLAGSGVLAALSAMGLAIGGLVALSGGPITLAIVGISTLIGLLVALKLRAADLPDTLDDINAEIDTQRTKLQKLMDDVKKMPEPFSIFSLGSKKDALRKEIAEITIYITKLKEAADKMRAAVAGQGAAPGASSPAGGGGKAPKFPGEGSRDFIGPLPATIADAQKALADWQEDFEDFADSQGDNWREIKGAGEDAATAFIDQRQREQDALDAHAEHMAEKVTAVAFLWGDMFATVLESEKNFAAAFGKATILALVKVLGAEARKAIAEILIKKVTELGKAFIGAPLSFGATLLAVGPIIAAAAVALGAIGAIESKFSKGFETGGVIPRTSQFLMHEGEVVYNPKKNTTADLAANLSRAGATREAAMLSGGWRGDTTVNADLHVHGPINGQIDFERALDKLAGKLARAVGAPTV